MRIPLTLSPVQQRRAAQVLLAFAALMAVDVIYQLGMHVTWRRWISRQSGLLKAAVASTTTQPAKDKPLRPPELAAELKKRNIFTAPRPKGHGLTLTGVIANRAFFATREGGATSIKEGESGNGIKVKSINGYDVVIEYEGKPETLKLAFGGGGGGGPPAAAMMASPGPVVAAPGSAPAGARIRVAPGAPPPGVDMSNLPPEIRERMQRGRIPRPQ
jgi:hypothetical protein